MSPPLAPHVQPQYYAAILAAHFIGHDTDRKTGATIHTHILELDVNDDRVSGYAAYDDGDLMRAVLINSQAYFTSQSTVRGSAQISFSFTGKGTAKRKMRVRRLAISSADIAEGLTYAGLSYEETGTGLVSGTEVWEDVHVADGVCVSDTEAVLVEFS